MTQNTLILQHLKRGRTLTAAEAYDRYGCMRLAARICDLRNQGLPIDRKLVTRNGRRWASYRLI